MPWRRGSAKSVQEGVLRRAHKKIAQKKGRAGRPQRNERLAALHIFQTDDTGFVAAAGAERQRYHRAYRQGVFVFAGSQDAG